MTADEEIQLVTFRIGAHVFAFSVLEVERVLRYEAPAPLPDAPDFLDGMLQQGGDVVPVIDLRRRLNVEAATREETRIVLVDWDDGKVGLVVDEVLELLKVPVSEVTAPPAIVQGLAAEFVNGIVARSGSTIIVFALQKLLTSKERLELAATTGGTSDA